MDSTHLGPCIGPSDSRGRQPPCFSNRLEMGEATLGGHCAACHAGGNNSVSSILASIAAAALSCSLLSLLKIWQSTIGASHPSRRASEIIVCWIEYRFNQLCGRACGSPPYAKASAIERFLAESCNVDAIKYQVTNGKNSMPAVAKKLGVDCIEDVDSQVFQQATEWN